MINAVLLVGGIGFVAALILGVSAVTFAVKMDPREKAVLDQLPGANCGACGFAGCAAFAHELVSNPDSSMACPAVNEQALNVISGILERELGGAGGSVAVVRCAGTGEVALSRYTYSGPVDCRAAQLIAGGPKACAFGCLGLGTCVDVCMFDAIHMGEDGLPHVDDLKCVGCGKCVESCPRNIIELVPVGAKFFVGCVSRDSAKSMKENCSVGCIKCRICENVCPFDAIDIDGSGCAVIDQERCRRCGLCASVCPNSVIKAILPVAKTRVIDDLCKGCGICAQVCPVDAITGKPKQPYSIDDAKCVGCGICLDKCPSNAIERQ